MGLDRRAGCEDDVVTGDTDRDIPLVIDVDTLDALREGGAPVVVADVRWYLDGRDARAAHETGHLPGAVFVDLDTDLAAHGRSVNEGRHPFPEPLDFARAMGRLGIGDDTIVVAYDDTGGMTASRLVMMLRFAGRRAALLDGGITAWLEIHPDRLETGVVRTTHASFSVTEWPSERFASYDDVRAVVDEGVVATRTVMLDARSAERFRGDVVSIDPRPGHLPNGFNAPWNAVLRDGRLADVGTLRGHFREFGVDLADDVIVSCGSGVSACLNALALEHAGMGTPRLFVASWSGWASDESRPVVTGDARPDRRALEEASARNTRRAIGELRRQRRRNRLAELEWFEALYRAYLAAFVFGGGALFISGFVPDEEVSATTAADFAARGGAWLGVVAAVAIAMGLRSGSRGGPLSLEEADVRLLLGAPVSRRAILLRPAAQRLRSLMFAGSMAGAFAGQLAGRRLPGTELAWASSGAMFGAAVAALHVGVALAAHGARLRPWIATIAALAVVGWQFATASTDGTGPLDALGDLALWGDRVEFVDLVPVAATVVITFVGLALVGRMSLEALSRRTSLVAQLRFAVTLQDLRTVMLLRRQLGHERTRSRPWIRLRRNRGHRPESRRGWHGLLRFPIGRILRILGLSVVAGLAARAALDGTTAAIFVSGIALFVTGLELVEPLAQEVDHGDRTDALPLERGALYVRLLVPTFGVSLVPASTIAGTVATSESPLLALLVAVPMLMSGLAGAIVNVVSGAPDPVSSSTNDNFMPPEVAGTMNIVRSAWPVVISILGGLPLLAARDAMEKATGPEAAAARFTIAIALGTLLVLTWVHRRDAIRTWLARAQQESRGGVAR